MYKETEAPTQILYEDPADKYMLFPKAVFDALLNEKHSGDLMAVYSFYCYMAKWQRTNQVYATNSYCMKGLKFGGNRFQRAKNKLIELGLVENIKTGNHGKWYILIRYIPKKTTITKELGKQNSCNSKNLEIKELGNQSTNSLSSYNLNSLSSNIKKSKQKKVRKIRRLPSKQKPTKKIEQEPPKKKELIDYFPNKWKSNVEFQKSINEFIQHRKTIRKQLTELACVKLSNHCIGYTIEEVCKAVDTTIMNGYTGLFPKKEYNNQSKQTNTSGTRSQTDQTVDYSVIEIKDQNGNIIQHEVPYDKR